MRVEQILYSGVKKTVSFLVLCYILIASYVVCGGLYAFFSSQFLAVNVKCNCKFGYT